ncbi:MAG: histidinol-phosphate transaminase [Pseudomonadota bacterium]|nr:histidinol-phosphate transaminase [Pseudomonadota bacterium]
MTVESVIRPEIRGLSAYHVADAKGLVKLDAMENPWPLPEVVALEMAQACAHASVNRYPDPRAIGLANRLRQVMAIPDAAGLLLGNGSDELIQMIAMACAQPGTLILGMEPSFVMYRMIAVFCRMRYVGVPLNDDFSINGDRVLDIIHAEQPALVFIAYPNNPTGNLFETRVIRDVIAASPGLVVVDEAYHAFAGESAINWIEEFENLLVMRTVSKLGLAGLRLGYLVGRTAIINEIDKVRLPYNINALTQAAGQVALAHHAVFEAQAKEICAMREAMLEELVAMEELEVYPSRANFILIRLARASEVFDGLKKKGILVKNLDKAHPLLEGCLRVTIGTQNENSMFINHLKDLVHL